VVIAKQMDRLQGHCGVVIHSVRRVCAKNVLCFYELRVDGVHEDTEFWHIVIL